MATASLRARCALKRQCFMRRPHSNGWPTCSWACSPSVSADISCRIRLFCTAIRAPLLEKMREQLSSHPSVAQCEFIDQIAYVVREETLADGGSLTLLGGTLEDWELKEFLVKKVLKWELSPEVVPQIRFVDSLPGSESQGIPFTLIHVLDALFKDIDTHKSGEITFDEFTAFCLKTGLFSSSEEEVRDTFFNARSLPSTSEILFNGSDLFQLDEFGTSANRIKFYDFQKLVLEAGIVEMTAHGGRSEPGKLNSLPRVTFFIDERVVDIVVRDWFAKCSSGAGGRLSFDDYAKLIMDYRLPFAVSNEAYRRLDRNDDGSLDVVEFRALLEEAGVLETGASVDKDDEAGKVWRDIEDSQQFLPPTSVFVADGREGTSPSKSPGSLRFVCISDTHGRHRELTSRLPAGDVLLHAGDFSMAGELDEVADFAAWLRSLPFSRKIVIAGNHDLPFDKSYDGHHSKSTTDAAAVRKAFSALCDGDDVVYLEDEECTIEGIRIYGSPWQPEFGYWAFNLPRGSALSEKWKAVPTGVDVLIVHGPPLGRGDLLSDSLKRAGCADLLVEIQSRIRPSFFICGHVHEGAGVTFDGTTHFLNACTLNEDYECIHAPLVFDMAVKSS